MSKIAKKTICVILLISTVYLVASCTNRQNRTLISKTNIRRIEGPNDLATDSLNATKHISSKKIESLAVKQAKMWDPGSSLILVQEFQRSIKTYSDPTKKEKIIITGWLFIFKNNNQGAWLGVSLGSNGIVDVGEKILPIDQDLSTWIEIPDWEKDIDFNASPNTDTHFKLMAFKSSKPNTIKIFWLETSPFSSSILAGKAYSASTAKEAREPINSINNEIKNRLLLWDVISIGVTIIL